MTHASSRPAAALSRGAMRVPALKPIVSVGIAVLSVVLLAACVANPAPPAVQEPEPVGIERAPEAPQSDKAPSGDDRANEHPRLFRFDRMSVSLSKDEKASVVAWAEHARNADAVLIRGFCDRAEVGNARDAAIARAQAVRKVLLKAGVPARSIRIRYNTERKMHAAEVELR